jgi:radical SAM protein with 4Fe4S-binding SPASM domain
LPVKKLLHSIRIKLERDLRVLRYLFIEITRQCNLSCLHCGSDCSTEMQGQELSTEQWIDFFNRLSGSFDPKVTGVVLTGGEPLARSDFFKITEIIHRNGFKWGMVTNGMLYTAEKVKQTVDDGMRYLTVSLDGLDKEHDHLRNKEGSFDAAVSAIKEVLKYPQIFFDVVTCVYPGNIKILPEIALLLISLGVKRWRLFSITAKGRADKNRELILSPNHWRDLIEWISKNRKFLNKKGLAVDFSCEGYFPGNIDRRIRTNPYFCSAGINIASVLYDGSVSACPNISRSLIQGNILTDDLAEIWEKRFEKFIDRGWLKKGRCAECGQWNKCQGNSLHLYDDDLSEVGFCHFNDIDFKILKN